MKPLNSKPKFWWLKENFFLKQGLFSLLIKIISPVCLAVIIYASGWKKYGGIYEMNLAHYLNN